MIRSIAQRILHRTRKPSILHRDIEPPNIFVGRGLVMKIGDFGISRRQVKEILDPNQTLEEKPAKGYLAVGTIGTLTYCASELLDDRLLSNYHDIERSVKWMFIPFA